MMRFLQLRFVALVQDLELNLQVGHEYGPFNPICDAGSRGKIDEMEAIMTNLGVGTRPRREAKRPPAKHAVVAPGTAFGGRAFS